MVLDLNADTRQAPLLLFDAADPANLGWFSRCQFYVDGTTGAVLQTPIHLANQRDRQGKALPNSMRLQINKELPASFRMPNKAAVSEQVVYSVLYNLLQRIGQYRRRCVRRNRRDAARGPHRSAGQPQLDRTSWQHWD